jgi:hypothetical protein
LVLEVIHTQSYPRYMENTQASRGKSLDKINIPPLDISNRGWYLHRNLIKEDL